MKLSDKNSDNEEEKDVKKTEEKKNLNVILSDDTKVQGVPWYQFKIEAM